jgi:GntR family transcriptional regulator, carbon starvation induced regulator
MEKTSSILYSMHNISVEQSSGPPLIEIALQRMKRSIVACDLEPGFKLKVDVLSKEYGISSSPIREALNRLAQEGIVHSSDNKGFRVAPISIQDLHEISRLRILLEGEALSESIERGDDAWEGNVLAAYHRLNMIEKRIGNGPIALDDDWAERHKAFHFALFSACTSPLLLGMIDSLFDRAERYRRYSALHRQTERHKSNEHQSLMKAALARDKDKASALLRRHIDHTKNSVSDALARQQASLQ